MPRLPLDIAQALDRIQRGGFAFYTAQTPCPHYPEPTRSGPTYPTPGPWRPPPEQVPRTPRPRKKKRAKKRKNPRKPRQPRASKAEKPPSSPPCPPILTPAVRSALLRVLNVLVDPLARCTAPDALGQQPHGAYRNSYVHRAELAGARLQAGWTQSRCLICLRWRWADEPCPHARFDQPPMRGEDPQENP